MKSLKTIRDVLHLSQVDLAALLGCSYSTVSRLERRLIEPVAKDSELLEALDRTAAQKKPPNLPTILHKRGRLAALKALAVDASTARLPPTGRRG